MSRGLGIHCLRHLGHTWASASLRPPVRVGDLCGKRLSPVMIPVGGHRLGESANISARRASSGMLPCRSRSQRRAAGSARSTPARPDAKAPLWIAHSPQRQELGYRVGILNPHPNVSRALQRTRPSFTKQIRRGVLASSQFPEKLGHAHWTITKPTTW